MTINEVFPNPTVEKVIFQIRFANLFFIENKIGDLQVNIMHEFPDSDLLFRRDLILINKFDNIKNDIDLDNTEDGVIQKIWQFRSPKGYKLNVLGNSLDISSEFHKTYNNPKGEHKFRDIIELVVNNFLNITNLPIFKRIGLRYIDKCPIPKKDNETFNSWYNSTFPLDRFNLSKSEEMQFKTVTNINNCYLRYIEALEKTGDQYQLRLDFDAFSNDIAVSTYLKTLDYLHEIIGDEYEKTIKKPVIDFMRRKS
jgi:uncharacterized protein (TIGR04255 family)